MTFTCSPREKNNLVKKKKIAAIQDYGHAALAFPRNFSFSTSVTATPAQVEVIERQRAPVHRRRDSIALLWHLVTQSAWRRSATPSVPV